MILVLYRLLLEYRTAGGTVDSIGSEILPAMRTESVVIIIHTIKTIIGRYKDW